MQSGIKSIMKLNKKQIYFLVFAFVLGFILINSLLNGTVSNWLSSLPKRIVQLFIPYGKIKWLDNFLINRIRKFAHLAEYFILGLMATKLYFYKKRTLQRLANTIFICFAVAFLDETIQLFSDRKSKITDIWIDLLGAFIGMAVYLIYKFFRNQKEKSI